MDVVDHRVVTASRSSYDLERGVDEAWAATTRLLREMIEREHQTPNPADLSGFLTSGTFMSQGQKTHGYWRITRALIDNLLGAQ